MITVSKDRYWYNLVDHYYDNIHWGESDLKPMSTLGDWLFKEYGAVICDSGHSLRFIDSKKYTYFMLLWS